MTRICIRSSAGIFVGWCLLALGIAACGSRNEGPKDVPVVGADSGPADVADAVGDADGSTRITCSDASSGHVDGGGCGCGDHVCGAHTHCEPGTKLCVTDAKGTCNSKGPWSSGTTAFTDASNSWNLPKIDASGVRISVTDLEGDGWPDLAVRKVGAKPNRYGGGDKRTVWLLRNTGNGTFEDVTKESNLLATRGGSSTSSRPAEIVVWGDVDNDGDLDAYTGFNKSSSSSADGNTAEIMLNEGDGTFELAEASSAIRRSGNVDMPAGASFVDFDRDGNLDLWVTQYGTGSTIAMRDRLYRGNGDGTFDNETLRADIDSKSWSTASHETLNKAKGHSRSWGSNACDLDGDGNPELLSSSYGRAPNHLWKATEDARGGISYENISVDSGYAYDDGTDWTDNAFAQCYCDANPMAEGCKKAPKPSGIDCSKVDLNRVWNHGTDREKFRLGGNTGTTLCADLDRDGQMDLLTNEIRHWWAGSSSDPSQILYNEKGDEIRFRRAKRKKTGLARTHDRAAWDEGDITSGVFDFDNDARPDIYIGSTDYPGTRGLLYHQSSDGTYEKVSKLNGIDHKSSHGIGLADFDRDGDVDVVVGHSRTRCGRGSHCYPESDAHVRLFENEVGSARNWLQLKLVGGEGTNRSAIGARVTVEAKDWKQVREVGGGHGHYGIQHDLTLQFGLGKACRAKVTVRWPNESLSTQTFVLKSGHRYRLEQGADPVVADVN